MSGSLYAPQVYMLRLPDDLLVTRLQSPGGDAKPGAAVADVAGTRCCRCHRLREPACRRSPPQPWCLAHPAMERQTAGAGAWRCPWRF